MPNNHTTPVPLCMISGCERRPLARGWCAMHYRRWKLYGDPSIFIQPQAKPKPLCECGCGNPVVRKRNRFIHNHDFRRPISDRFWPKVNKDGPVPAHVPELGNCWEWTGNRLPRGYGQFGVNYRSRYAHRVGYELQIGPVPLGLDVCHKCDNPPCVRGAHLFAGTRKENVADMMAKGRYVPHAPVHLTGITNPLAKLNDSQVLDIRARVAAGLTTQRALAKEYHVSVSAICMIISRKRWGHI